MITYNDFEKLDLRVGKVLECVPVLKSNSLLKMQVDIGEETPRTIVSGIKQFYNYSEMVGKNIIIIANLKPRKIFGIKSQGMILAADVDEKAVLLKVDDKYNETIIPGTKIE